MTKSCESNAADVSTGVNFAQKLNILKGISSRRQLQWPRGLRHDCAAARLQGLRVRIPPRAWMSVCCECCVLSGRGLCVGLITRPEESYRL